MSTSVITEKQLKIRESMDRGNVVVQIIEEDGSSRSIQVKAAHFVGDVAEADIPGVTITYTAPIYLPKTVGTIVVTADKGRVYVRTGPDEWRATGSPHYWRDDEVEGFMRHGATVVYEPED